MKNNFTIETERIILRPFTMNDVDEFAVICADPEVMQFIGTGAPLDKETVQQQMQSWIALYEKQGFGLLALVWKENNRLLGFCGLMQQEVDGQTHIELGYRLEKAFWGKGIATEAALAMRDYALMELSIPELVSIIQLDNIASKNVAKKVGMTHWKRTLFNGVLLDVFKLM
ncbi:MAG: GNAT family N-acetyltransferase [Legionella sp.]|nr:GNAT family N-acetyltransferase [Legionella sp.]